MFVKSIIVDVRIADNMAEAAKLFRKSPLFDSNEQYTVVQVMNSNSYLILKIC